MRQGYDATSLQAIADEMGVTKANVYYYFRTKAEILEALLAPMADALDRLLDAAERLPHGARARRADDGGLRRPGGHRPSDARGGEPR